MAIELKTRFGPAGVPPGCASTLEALSYVKDEGLDAFEMEFVQGVRMGAPLAGEIGVLAKKLDISLSCHAPYWINCCALEELKLRNSVRHLTDCIKVGEALGDQRFVIVFHPGFYLGQSPAEAGRKIKATMESALSEIRSRNLRNVVLGMETTGKQSQFGTLEEILAICSQLELAVPVIDFAHLHARSKGGMKTEADYLSVFEKAEKSLGPRIARTLHCHFSELNFDPVKGNEKNHVPIGTGPGPDFRPLARVISTHKFSPTIICESPLLDKDALKLKAMLEDAAR
ncbi:MAG: TIM barrel protein [archaeon]